MSEMSVMPAAMFHAERILDGSKTALLIPAVTNDHYRTAAAGPLPDDEWHPRDDGFVHGRLVHTVHHLVGYHSATDYVSATGGIASIRALPSQDRIAVRIVEIRMVECARLSDGEINELGYPDRAAYMADMGEVLQRRKAWFVRIIPLPPAPRAPQ